jgi:LPXTG-motif cell wall-anchored protein
MHNEEEKNIPTEMSYQTLALTTNPGKKNQGFVLAGLGALGLIALVGSRHKKNKV